LRIKQELATLAKTKKNQQKEVETLLVGKIKPELLTSGSKSLEYIHQKQIETNTRKSIQEEQVNLARTVLIEARKGRKTMEKLKENYMIREQQKIMVTEQKRLDEVANNLFYREQR
jgi:flagellar export protein FliJ